MRTDERVSLCDNPITSGTEAGKEDAKPEKIISEDERFQRRCLGLAVGFVMWSAAMQLFETVVNDNSYYYNQNLAPGYHYLEIGTLVTGLFCLVVSILPLNKLDKSKRSPKPPRSSQTFK